MSAEKLRSDEVPEKFAHWLLAMGCPTEKVPSIEKITEMCRGQYYMIWRSLMENVEAKNVIRQKRLQVFCDDVKIYQERNAFSEHNSDTIVPGQLVLWKEQQEINEKVTDAETWVEQTRNHLNELTDEISCKISQRNSSRRRIDDLQRRVWLLRQVANELTAKKAHLEETREIANSLCHVDSDPDIQNKFDKCITVMQRKQATSISNPVANSSMASTQENETSSDKDEIMSLVNCRGDALWPLLYERRSALVATLSAVNSKCETDIIKKRSTPQSVLAHTAALHCNLALGVMKNKVLVKQTHNRFVVAVEELNNYITGEACELLVLRCERARSEARLRSLKNLLEELSTRSGVFTIEGDDYDDNQATLKKISNINKCIINARDELKRTRMSLVTTERKINNIREYLIAIFESFHNNMSIKDNERYQGALSDFPQSIPTILQFYEERCDKNRNNGNLSLDFDISDASLDVNTDNNPRFVDELKVYLKTLNLEKNRKLVLASGEKIWVFESLKSLASKLNSCYIDSYVTPLLCPSVRLSKSLQQLIHEVQEKNILTNILNGVNKKEMHYDLDISSKIEHEADANDKIKKRTSENLALLQKINKTVELCKENLQFWSNFELKKYISNNRTVEGKTFRDIEAFYLEEIELNS